jgi:hypothetical protein
MDAEYHIPKCPCCGQPNAAESQAARQCPTCGGDLKGTHSDKYGNLRRTYMNCVDCGARFQVMIQPALIYSMRSLLQHNAASPQEPIEALD